MAAIYTGSGTRQLSSQELAEMRQALGIAADAAVAESQAQAAVGAANLAATMTPLAGKEPPHTETLTFNQISDGVSSTALDGVVTLRVPGDPLSEAAAFLPLSSSLAFAMDGSGQPIFCARQ